MKLKLGFSTGNKRHNDADVVKTERCQRFINFAFVTSTGKTVVVQFYNQASPVDAVMTLMEMAKVIEAKARKAAKGL